MSRTVPVFGKIRGLKTMEEIVGGTEDEGDKPAVEYKPVSKTVQR
jgi:hypothetical protein